MIYSLSYFVEAEGDGLTDVLLLGYYLLWEQVAVIRYLFHFLWGYIVLFWDIDDQDQRFSDH